MISGIGLFLCGVACGLVGTLWFAAMRRILRSLRSSGVAFVPGATYRLHSGQTLQVEESPTWCGTVKYSIGDKTYEAPATDIEASVRSGAYLKASDHPHESGEIALVGEVGR